MNPIGGAVNRRPCSEEVSGGVCRRAAVSQGAHRCPTDDAIAPNFLSRWPPWVAQGHRRCRRTAGSTIGSWLSNGVVRGFSTWSSTDEPHERSSSRSTRRSVLRTAGSPAWTDPVGNTCGMWSSPHRIQARQSPDAPAGRRPAPAPARASAGPGRRRWCSRFTSMGAIGVGHLHGGAGRANRRPHSATRGWVHRVVVNRSQCSCRGPLQGRDPPPAPITRLHG